MEIGCVIQIAVRSHLDIRYLWCCAIDIGAHERHPPHRAARIEVSWSEIQILEPLTHNGGRRRRIRPKQSGE